MSFLAEAPVTYALIVVNVAVSLLAFANMDFFRSWMFSVGHITREGEIHRVITSGFLHASPAHLLFNMLTLWFFGPWLEQPDMLGRNGMLIVYFGSLLAGNGWALVENFRKLDYTAVGASGAISGVVLAFCLYKPFAMLLVFFILPLPAIVFAVLYISYSAFAMGRDNSNIGHEAHLGGAIGGLVITLVLQPGILNHLIDQIL